MLTRASHRPLAVGIAWGVGGQAKVATDLSIHDGKVIQIDMIASADSFGDLGLTLLDP